MTQASAFTHCSAKRARCTACVHVMLRVLQRVSFTVLPACKAWSTGKEWPNGGSLCPDLVDLGMGSATFNCRLLVLHESGDLLLCAYHCLQLAHLASSNAHEVGHFGTQQIRYLS